MSITVYSVATLTKRVGMMIPVYSLENIKDSTDNLNLNYIKVEHNGFLYYIKQKNVIHILNRLDNVLHPNEDYDHLVLGRYSDYIIDKNKNVLLKCRCKIESLIDSYI